MRSEQIEGFFLSFSTEEADAIRAALEEEGYTPDGEGLKEVIVDALFGEEEKVVKNDFVGKAQKFLADNPETVRLGMRLAQGLFKRARR